MAVATIKEIALDDPVHVRLAGLSGYSKDAWSIGRRVRAALMHCGYDFTFRIDESDFVGDSGYIEFDLETMFGDCADCKLHLQWQLSRRLGELSYSVFIN